MESFVQIAKEIISKFQKLLMKVFHEVKTVAVKLWPHIQGILQKIRHFLLYASRRLVQGIRGIFNTKNQKPDINREKTITEHSARKPSKTKPIRRLSREKVYRLKGYTTVAKVNRKRKSERRQRLLRKTLLIVIVILVVIVLVKLFNPIDNLTEWYRVIGIDDLSEIIGNSSATSAVEVTEATTESIIETDGFTTESTPSETN